MNTFERKRTVASTFPFAMVVSVGFLENKEVTQGGLKIGQLEGIDDGIDWHISEMWLHGNSEHSCLIIGNMAPVLCEQR